MAIILADSLFGVFPLGLFSSLSQTTRSTALYLLIISSLLLVPNGIPHSDIPSKSHSNNPLAADSTVKVPTCTLKNGLSHVTMHGTGCPGVHKFYEGDVDTLSSMFIDNLVEFVPPILHFDTHPVGQHTNKPIQIINHSQTRVLHLTSVSGTSSDFHPSFFQSEFVLPGEYTYFDVYFLPRIVGPIESTLNIHSEDGFTFPLPVSGVGTTNSYHLRSLSARIPLNYSYNPTVSVYNPHGNALQITEMYSTALDLHLELLSSTASASWEVPPYQSKEVMRVNFFADRLDHYTAFIRIKTNFDSETGAQLIIPLEVEVVSRENIISATQELDFGLIRSSDELKAINITLYNPSQVTYKVTSLSASRTARYIKTQLFQPALVYPGVVLSVGALRLNPRDLPLNLSLITGSVLVNVSSGEGSNKRFDSVRIPYRARIEYGHLNVPNLNLHSSVLPSRPQTVSVWLSHTFRHSLAVFDAKISYTESEEDTGYLSLHEFHWPLLILPHDRAVILSLRFMPTRALIFSQSYLQLHTNTSRFRIPIHIYNQQLELTNGADDLEFGVIHPNITKNHFFKVRNLNADVITIREMIISNPHLTFEKMIMLPLQEGQLISVTGSEVPFVIQSRHEATLHYKLTRPTSGDINTDVILVTDHQRLYVRVHYRSISGTLEAQRITFQPSFPGHVEKRDIIVRNTFTQTVRVNDLRRIDPTDPRIYLEDPSIGRIELSAFSSTHIAKLAFDPIRGFPGKVFTGGFSETQSTDWLNSLDLRSSAAEVDTRLYERTQAIWKECQNEELTRAAAIFELDTDLVSGIRVEVEASLQWPSITPDAPIHFPLTLIGNYSTRSVPVFNPGDLPLVVQALLLHLYPDEQAALDIVDDWLDIPSSPSRRVSPFSLIETVAGMYHRPDTTHPTSYLEALDKSVSDLAWTYILPPKSTINITVAFEPRDEDPVFSVVLFRNNLTVMDAVVIQGSGAEGKFSLDGKSPGSDETLFFNMTQDELVECSRQDQISPSALSLTHTYIARNQGQLSIHIESLSINGYPCQGFGFSIRQCRPFTLKPNSSTEIDITFTPDFTLYYIHRELILMTRHGQRLTFKLYSVIPAEYLPLCSRVTMRASWEPYLPYITLPVLLAALLLAIYLSLQPDDDDILNMPIPGMRNSYSAEGMDKVLRLASMFSFSGGIDENPEELKRKLDQSSSLVKSIVTMQRQVSGDQDGERTPRIGAIISPIQSPIHQDMMDIIKSSYKPELSFTVSNGSSGIHRQEYNNHNGTITGIVSPQKTSVVKPIQILEKQSQLTQQLSEEVKRDSVLKPTPKPKPEPPVEVTPKHRNEEKKERISKPDLKVAIPSNDVSSESELKRDSPTTPPAVEAKKLFQPIRPGKYKKSKSRKQKEKEKSKPSKPNSPSPDVLQSQDIQETSLNEVNEEQLPDNSTRKSIVNPTRLSIYNSAFSKTNQSPSNLVSTPPKGPLPLHRSISNESPICTQKTSPGRKPDTTLTNEKVQEQSRTSPLKSTVQEVKPFKRELLKNNLTESTKSKSEEDKTQLLPPDSNKGLRIMNPNEPTHPNIQNYTTIPNPRSTLPKSAQYVKDRSTLPCNIQSAVKELSVNQEQKNKRLVVSTREEDKLPRPSSPVRAKVKKEIVKEETKETASKLPFSDLSEELRQRIEEVCAPLTLDTPFLTGEPHEQLSSILSTDAEPFVPDANVVRQLLENNHVPQSIKKSPRKFPQQQQQQPQQQLLQQPQQQKLQQQPQQQQPQQLQQPPIQLDQHTLSQLSILLQDPSQTCLPQSDYINLLANSLGIQPRILSLHLQYCWLSYYCNLINMTAAHPKPQAPPIDTPIYTPVQEVVVGKQQSMLDKPITAVLEEVPSDIPLTHKDNFHNIPHSSGYTANTNINMPASNSVKWPLNGKNLKANKPANFAKSSSGGSRGNSGLFGTFSHWADSPKGKGNNWKVSPNKDSVLTTHDDSSYFESTMEYDDVKEDSLSRSDPWRREGRQKQWGTSSKQEPPPLSATELLPTELMTSRPPSPVFDQASLPAGAPRSQASIGQQPSIFLGNTIWSDRESITEEDRLNSWSNLTGKFAQKGNPQARERMYNPFGEGSWGPLEDIGRRKKGGRPE